MSDKVKLVALLTVAFIATGAVVYQLMNRSPARTGVVLGPPGGMSAAATPTPAAPAAAPPAAITPSAGARTAQAITAPVADPEHRPQIPATGWARNPFLTPEEIDRLNHPEEPVAEAPPPPKPATPAPLPGYSVTGIITGGAQGNWAIIDSRTVRAGDRLGSETIAQIKDRSVVLEHDGHTRELPLKSLEDTSAAAPRKEAKQ